MMLNYNPLDDGRDTWSKNDVGDTTGSPPLTRTAPSWWRGLSLVFALFIGLHAFALGGDKSKATLADAATTCAGATVLSPSSLPISGQAITCGSTNDLTSGNVSPVCGGATTSYMGGNEALYSFTPTLTGDYQVSIAGQSWTGIFVYQGCPTAGGTCVGSVGSSATSKSLTVALTAGLEYFIWFDTWPTPNSPCPGTFSLISLSAPPACVTSTVPADAATNTARNVLLSWTAPSGNATSYDVYFGTDASPAFIGNQTGLTYAPGLLAANTTYYWSVVAKNSFGDATGCLTRSFTTGTQLVYCAASPTSNDGAGVSNVQIGGANYPTGDVTYANYTSNPANVVRGENLDLFVTYATGWAYSTYVWIDLNNDGDFTDSGEMVISGVSAADNPTTLDLSFTPSASIPLGSYRMRIIGGDGIAENPCYSGSWAVALDFVINIVDPITGAPGCASTLSPADAATNVLRLATLTWNSVFGADAYDLYFGTTPTLTSTDLLSADMTATTYTFATALAANTTYYWSVVPKNESGSAADCVVQSFTTGTLSAPYCVPIYTSGKTDGDLISNIVISGTTLANNTGTEEVNPAYTYFTGQPNYTAELQAGSSYQVAVTVGSYGNQNVAVWIDYNDNSIFETSERVGFTTTSIAANGSATFTISLACNPPLGTHRMRVRDVFATAGNVIDPCNSYGFGETEDYDVTITAADACPQPKTFALASTTADGAVVTWAAGCVETAWEVVVQAAGTGTPTGSGVAVSEATYTATGLGAGSYEVYVRANCDTNGFSSWVGPVNFQLLDCPVLNFPADAATGVAVDGGIITFEWDAVANATGYDFMIGTSPTTLALVDTVTELEIPITGFAYNTTYYWSVYPVGSAGTPTACAAFSFTTQGPPANDVCSGAISLDALTSPITGSTVGLANDFIPSCNSGNTAPDSFYSITVPAGYTLAIGQVSNNYDSVHTAFYGSCAEQTLIICRDDSDTQLETWTNTTGTTQTVYWVQDGYSAGSGLFELAWTLTPPPVVVSSFSPEAVCGTGGGDTVVITGSNFVNVSSVQFNGIEAASFVVDSSTQITAVVPAGDVAGLISVSSQPSTNGTGSSAGPLTVNEFPAVDPITPSETQSLCVGGQIYYATVTPTGLWSSADENIATVDANGLVTAVGLGNTTISYTVTLETGCATTVTRDVQVYQPIEVLSQPSNIAVTTGSPASFSVVATGSVVGATWEISNDNGFSFEPLTIAPPYSTSFDSGTNTYTLSISSAENEMSGGYYRLYLDAESPCGDAASFSALLNVGSTGIATQPSSVNICSPTTSEVSFTVVPSGPVDSYQWYVDYGFGPFPITDPVDLFYPEISYSNFDTATLTVSGLTTDHNGLVFSVDVVGPLNTVNSNQAVLTVNGSVEITDQPDATQTCSSGGSANLSFAYSGSAMGVQWQYATSAAGPFGPISNGVPAGFTYNTVGASLTVDNAAGVATGVHYYRAVIDAASPCTDVITDVASLEVVAPTLVLNTTTASYCTPGPGVTLSVSGAVNYSWSPATGLDTNEGSTVVASPSTTTTYTVTGTDANGCSSTAQVTVNVGPAIQAAATASASLICEGASSTLSANGILSFTPPAVNNYVFSTQTGTSLDPMDGAVTLLGTSFDDTASALANIGFSFNYEGNTYTTFSVTPDGFLKLGTVTTTQFSNSMSSTTNIPKIAAFWDDMATGTTGSVRYVVTGTAPNRVLKVEWFTTIPRNTSGPANSRFQAWLYESNSAIELRYGAMGTGTSSATVGLRSAQTAVVHNSVTVSTNTASTATTNDSNAGQPANGRMYRFVPNNAPTFTYSWTSVPEGFTSTLQNPTVSPTQSTTYNVVVTSSAGCSANASVSVTIESGVDITTQPVGTTVCQGQSFTLSVAASGPGLTYQWRRNGENISGATSSTYTVATGLPANSGSYDVVITPSCGPVATSDAVTVTVNPTPTATAPAAVSVCTGAPTAAIPLTGTPAGVTFDITGGTAIGLANQTGVTQIPSFTPQFGAATITITPVANGCTGTPVTFSYTVNDTPSALVVTPEASSICSNDAAVMLTATGGIGGRIATIGTQSTTTSSTGISPFTNGWESQRTQYLIRASELTAAGLSAGDLQGMQFTVTSAGGVLPMLNYTVRIANTTATAVSSGTFLSGTFTTVYSNPSEPAVTVGQKTFNFSTPFAWNGTSNIVVEICHDNDPGNTGVLYDTTATVAASSPGFTAVTARYADNNTLCGTTNGTATSSSTRPLFTFIAANQQAPITWSPIAGLYTNAAATVPYTGTNAAVVYAKPEAGTATYTATALANGCSSTDTASVTVTTAQDWYVDADLDGYGDANLPVAYTGCAQTGYANNNTDCNDDVASVNPGATEIAYNGIDDDCDGIIDEGSQVFSQVLPSQCGTTVANIASLVGAVSVPAGTGYRFEVTNTQTNAVEILDRGVPNFAFTQLASFDYATTYSIRVMVQRNGVWLNYYGTPCLVSTPAVTAPEGAAQVNPSQCGQVLSSINTLIATTSLPGVVQYRFRVTDLTDSDGPNQVQILDRPLHWFSLKMLTRYNYGTTYSVEVAVRTSGSTTFSGFGAPCTVTTPAVPILNQCDQVIATAGTNVSTVSLNSVTQYRFVLTSFVDFAVTTVDRPLNYFRFNDVPNYIPGGEYGVQVAVMTSGQWSPLSDACLITAPSAARQDVKTNAVPFNAVAYPNPFADTFQIELTTSAEANVDVKVYDMTGRMLEQKTVPVSQMQTLQVGERYPAGVYNVIVTQGEQAKTLRVIKR